MTPGRRIGLDDETLALRLADGDERALAALYDRWSAQVHTVAFWILRDPDEAEDIVEETFWHAWRMAARYDGARGAISTWLMMIARCRALDCLRRRNRRAARLEAWKASALPQGDGSSGPVPLAPPFGEEQAYGELAAGLAALPPEQRDALDLAFFTGLSHAEIAQRMGWPVGTVKTRIRLALQKLRRHLGVLAGERE